MPGPRKPGRSAAGEHARPASRAGAGRAAPGQAGCGHRHGKAAVYWQIGDSSGADAQPFYRDLLRGISEANQEITGLYELPDLTARWDYDRDSLAADLGLARDGPGMAEAADTYLAAAREEFWLEAARLARGACTPARTKGPATATRPAVLTPSPGRGRPRPRPKTRTTLKPRTRTCGRTSPTGPAG